MMHRFHAKLFVNHFNAKMIDKTSRRALRKGSASHDAPRWAGPKSAARVRANDGRRKGRRLLGAALALVLFAGGCVTPTPRRQGNVCAVFDQRPKWYAYARESTAQWGTPPHVLMAFVKHESSFMSHARPPFRWFLFIPLGRASSAKGYAQALDATWREYESERGGPLSSRADMEDALDFVGWYNAKTRRELGISLSDARRLYLAYHEGRGGYRRGTWKRKPWLQRKARKVAATARRYKTQLAGCESRFRCASWYQIWPFCQ